MKRTGLVFLSLVVALMFTACESRFATRDSEGAGLATKVETPIISPETGSFPAGTLITITTATAGAVIKYTTDGTTPSKDAGSTYTAPIALASDKIKAMAFKEDLEDSEVSIGNYAVQAPYSPQFTPAGGTYKDPINSDLELFVVGSTYDKIRYTNDNSSPTETSGYDYTAPLSITNTGTTIKAVTVKAGVLSAESSALYTLQVDEPTIDHTLCLSPLPTPIPALSKSSNKGSFELISSAEASLPPAPPSSAACAACIKVTRGTETTTPTKLYWRYSYTTPVSGTSTWAEYTAMIPCDNVEAAIPGTVNIFNIEVYAAEDDPSVNMSNSPVVLRTFTR